MHLDSPKLGQVFEQMMTFDPDQTGSEIVLLL